MNLFQTPTENLLFIFETLILAYETRLYTRKGGHLLTMLEALVPYLNRILEVKFRF